MMTTSCVARELPALLTRAAASAGVTSFLRHSHYIAIRWQFCDGKAHELRATLYRLPGDPEKARISDTTSRVARSRSITSSIAAGPSNAATAKAPDRIRVSHNARSGLPHAAPRNWKKSCVVEARSRLHHIYILPSFLYISKYEIQRCQLKASLPLRKSRDWRYSGCSSNEVLRATRRRRSGRNSSRGCADAVVSL